MPLPRAPVSGRRTSAARTYDAAREFGPFKSQIRTTSPAANSPSQRATPAAAGSCPLAQGSLPRSSTNSAPGDDGNASSVCRPCNFVGDATNSVPSSSPARIFASTFFFLTRRNHQRNLRNARQSWPLESSMPCRDGGFAVRAAGELFNRRINLFDYGNRLRIGLLKFSSRRPRWSK